MAGGLGWYLAIIVLLIFIVLWLIPAGEPIVPTGMPTQQNAPSAPASPPQAPAPPPQ